MRRTGTQLASQKTPETVCLSSHANRGERDEVRINSGNPVLTVRTGSESRTHTPTDSRPKAEGSPLFQTKTVRGLGGRAPKDNARGEAATLTASDLLAFVEFFELLDKWDRDAQ